MNRTSSRADFFDASALVKVYTDEPASATVREYWRMSATKYTTPFCFYEAMNVLKSKWKYKSQLTLPQYLDAAFQMTAWYGASSARINDLDFADPLTFADTRALAERNGLDLSDAFQIMSVKRGYFSVLINDSATVLVTADSSLAAAARNEGLQRVWNLMLEPPLQ
jgi:predicted nucleic acid-binding protein